MANVNVSREKKKYELMTWAFVGFALKGSGK